MASLLKFETAKSATRIALALATQDPAGFVGGLATLANIYRLRVERPLRTELERLVSIEFRNISREDVTAVDEAVKSLIEGSAIDATLAAARPAEAARGLMRTGGSEARRALGTEDLANLFDQFLLTTLREIGQAATILPGFARDASTRALREAGDATSGVERVRRDLADAVEAFSTRLAPGGSAVPVDMAVAGFRRSLDEYIPDTVDPRLEEISRIRTFVAGDGEQWWGWRGEAWSGKSTLMALTLSAIEEEHSVVPFFISGRQVNSRGRRDFIERTLPRLAQLCGEESVPPTTQAIQLDVYRAYLLRAAAVCADQGRSLVLLIDGLDEDADASGGSVLATVPSRLPSNVRVVVASRVVALPMDVHETHPLRSDASWRALTPSPLASAAQTLAEDDVGELLETDLGRGVAEILAAAGAPLTLVDIAELLDSSPARIRDAVIRNRVGRCLVAVSIPPIDPRDSGPVHHGYMLAHEEIFRQIILELEPRLGLAVNTANWQTGVAEALSEGRRRIVEWADRWSARGWPLDTPRYLIREYADLLATTRQCGRLFAMASSPERRNLLRQAWGVPWRAQYELATAVRLVAADDPIDMTAIANACTTLSVWMPNSYLLDPRTPETWARVGRTEYADYLCQQMDEFTGREARARLLRLALLEGNAERAAHLEEELSKDSGGEVVDIVRRSAMGSLTADALVERVIPSDELSYEEDWDLSAEIPVAEDAAEPNKTARAVGHTPPDAELAAMSQEDLALELLTAAERGDHLAVTRVARGLHWEMAGAGYPGHVSRDGKALARALVRLGAAEDVLAVLRVQAAQLENSGAISGEVGLSEEASEELANLSSLAEGAAWMMMHIATALRRSGAPAQADRVAGETPDSFSKDEYLEIASREAAAGGEVGEAISYLRGIQNTESIVRALGHAALLAAWRGDEQAAEIAKAAEMAAHEVHFSGHGARILHAFASATLAIEVSGLQEDLIKTAGILIGHVEHPDECWRLIQRQAGLIRQAWGSVNGPDLVAGFDRFDITSMVHSGLAYDAASAGDAAGAATHLAIVSDIEDQSRVARGLVRLLSPDKEVLLHSISRASPEWVGEAIHRARAELLEEAARWPQQAAAEDGLPSWVRGQERGHFERAWAEIARLNLGTEVQASDAVAALDDVIADLRYSDEAADLIGVLLKSAHVPTAITAIRDAIVRGDGQMLESGVVAVLVGRALELDDEALASKLVADAEDCNSDDALEVIIEYHLRRDNEESASLYATAISGDYTRANVYRDLSIHALRAGRQNEANRFRAHIPADYVEILREVREVEFELAAGAGHDPESRRLLAAEMLDSPMDGALLSRLVSVSLEAVTSAARVAIVEALDRQARLSDMTLIETLAASLSNSDDIRPERD